MGIFLQRIVLAMACVTGLTGEAIADRFDGKYRPVGDEFARWDCHTVGRDGGALAIQNDVFFGVESRCDLSSPVNVNGMNAVLYDAKCSGEGYEWSERVMFMASEKGVYYITKQFVAEWQSCEAK